MAFLLAVTCVVSPFINFALVYKFHKRDYYKETFGSITDGLRDDHIIANYTNIIDMVRTLITVLILIFLNEHSAI